LRASPDRNPLTVTRPALLRGGGDRAFRDFVHDLLAFTARLQAIRDGFGAFVGLTGPQYTILISVAHLETQGDVYVGTVAEHLHYSGAYVTIETGRLAGLGLISKRPSGGDRRRVCLAVTAAGRGLLSALAAEPARVNDILFGPLEAADFARMRTLLPALVESAEAAQARLGEAIRRERPEAAE
jgi:MarR family transcriptional regulator, organic hydroperoxide resistance regulator